MLDMDTDYSADEPLVPGLTTPAELLNIYFAFREEAAERDERWDTMVDILNKDWDLKDSGGEDLDPASPNLIGTALEDTAEASSTVPTIRVRPMKVTAQAKGEAQKMEQIASGYLDTSQIELEIPRYVMDMGAFGVSPLVVLPDFSRKQPVIVKRDPLSFYVEDTFHPGDLPRRAMLVREVDWTQLLPEHRAVLAEWEAEYSYQRERDKVVMVEYYTAEEMTIAAIMHTGRSSSHQPHTQYQPVLLEQMVNPIGVCPVIPLARPTWDNEFRGQFDDVIDSLLAHAKLMAMVVDFADQSVYSDIWARDVIGDVPFGGGSYIELGPNGAIGRVPPAVNSLDIWRDLDRLEDHIHVGGRWPKSRPGQIDQAIASGKFVEATVGMMSTVIKTMHQVMARGLAHALRICYLTDIAYFGGVKKTVSGTVKNQQFLLEYTPRKDINLDHRVTVEYGLGLGRDANSSAVLMMNYAKEEYISREFVQENIDGLTDVERERKRIDLEKIEKIMFARLLQGVEQGEVPVEKLPDIHEAREKGDSLVKLFRDHLVPDPEDIDPLAALGLPPALAAGPGGGGPGPPGGPGPLPLPPPPPEARQMLSRIVSPAGPGGSKIGSQVAG